MEPIATTLIAAAIKSASEPIGKWAKSMGKEAYAVIAEKLDISFKEHINNVYTRCLRMKNIIYKDRSVDFYSQYVSILFSLNKNSFSDLQVFDALVSGEKLAIIGTAGAGKTMFMRWCALELISKLESLGRIPLYIEMRDIEEKTEITDFGKFIFEKTSSSSGSLEYDIYLKGLQNGHFIVLLDGIDEIKPTLRETVLKGIVKFIRHNPKSGIIMSSRSDTRLESLQELTVYRTKSMIKSQIIEVIKRIDYDKLVKDKLIKELNSGLYEKLNEFLSNPLLATIMLLTFDYSAEIPTKLTNFYQQAFEALYQRHDAAKGAFKRALHSGLPIDSFQNVFSAFCFITFVKFQFEFSDDEIVREFREACKWVRVETNPELILLDTMESACLIQRDGLKNIFSHRSFQEYFCALYISKYRGNDIKKILKEISKRDKECNVLKMLFEISPDLVETEFIIDELIILENFFSTKDLSDHKDIELVLDTLSSSLIFEQNTGKMQSIIWKSNFNFEVDFYHKAQNIRKITNGKIDIWGQVFSKGLWDNPEDFLQSIPTKLLRDKAFKSISNITEIDKTTGVECFETHSDDAGWLKYSKFPIYLKEFYLDIKNYKEEINIRTQSNAIGIDQLLSFAENGK